MGGSMKSSGEPGDDKKIEQKAYNFGCPELKVQSRELKRIKGKIWFKHWSKDPLPGNYLPDHFK
jgi:hypothetical protein